MKIIFIFGVQRSGTSILSSLIGELEEVQYYPETNAEINSENRKEAGQTIRLKDLDEVKKIFALINNKKLIVAKPLVESQYASNILNTFENSYGFWNYRDVKDVVSSFMVEWNIPKPSIFFESIIKKSDRNWRSENIPVSSRMLFDKFYEENMSIEDAIALFWLIRNNMYFDQKLFKNSKVRLIDYTKMVTQKDYIQIKIDSLGLGVSILQENHKLNSKSIGKGKKIVLSAKLEEECKILYKKLQIQDLKEC